MEEYDLAIPGLEKFLYEGNIYLEGDCCGGCEYCSIDIQRSFRVYDASIYFCSLTGKEVLESNVPCKKFVFNPDKYFTYMTHLLYELYREEANQAP